MLTFDVADLPVGPCEVLFERTAAAGLFKVCKFIWNDMQEAEFAPARSFVELTSVRAKGCCLTSRNPSMIDQGAIRFYDERHRFYSRWIDRTQTSLYCVLDIPRLTGVDLQIDDERTSEMLNLRNGFLWSVLIRIRQELETPSIAGDLLIDTLGLAAAAEIVQHFAPLRRHSRLRGALLGRDYLVRLARRLRDERFQVSVATLANELEIGERQFARLFKASFQEGLASFTRQCFVGAARELLSNERLLIKEVAYRCGFADPAAFSRAFRRATGQTAQAYRAECARGTFPPDRSEET
jgi:AraC family transcriptional regulator